MGKCEWNPTQNHPAMVFGISHPFPQEAEDHGNCQNEATVCVGADGEWHLCENCAALPAFKRFKVRRLLQKATPSEPDCTENPREALVYAKYRRALKGEW